MLRGISTASSQHIANKIYSRIRLTTNKSHFPAVLFRAPRTAHRYIFHSVRVCVCIEFFSLISHWPKRIRSFPYAENRLQQISNIFIKRKMLLCWRGPGDYKIANRGVWKVCHTAAATTTTTATTPWLSAGACGHKRYKQIGFAAFSQRNLSRKCIWLMNIDRSLGHNSF